MRKSLWLLVLLVLGLFIPGTGRAQDDRRGLLSQVETVVSQLDLAIQQTAFGAFSVTLEEVQRNAQQVINLLVGPHDPSFDARVPPLGDEIGLVEHVNRLVRQLSRLDAAREYRITADNVRFFVQASLELLKGALRTDASERARVQVRTARGLLLAARGAPDDLPSEAGARALLRFLKGL